jgi:hypothetical protein
MAKPAGMEGGGFFEEAKAHKDQQSRSLIVLLLVTSRLGSFSF